MTAWPDQNKVPERGQSLASVMTFMGGEIDHSLAMLRDLASCLSDVILALDEESDSRPCLLSATQALQNEDRIQQRLSDLRSTLLVLEHVLQAGTWPPAVDLDRVIIDQLRLDEMREAYAASVGMPCDGTKVMSKAGKPSAGDVDLF
ncbi:MAG: hypothetical protein ACR2QH_13110 [Geminicoccaceae bacterium]